MIEQSLLDNYRRTTYRAELPAGRIDLRIDQSSRALDQFLAEKGADEWAFVTAYNPGSRQIDEKANLARHQSLVADVRAAGHSLFEGAGIGDDDNWPAERGLLIVGIRREAAAALGRKYKQNAIVVGRRGNAPELLLLA